MKERYIDSSSKKDRIHVCIWMPEKKPKIVVQLTHGMSEYIGRYRELALYLNANGIGVVGHDTLGHGKSASSTSQQGFFAKKNGDKCLVADIARVNSYIRKQYPTSKIVLIGHSMGSFVSRAYLTKYPDKVDAAILMGTGDPHTLKVDAGMAVACFLRILHGDFYRSELIHNLMLESNDRYFFDQECKSWLTSDQSQADLYYSDSDCGFMFTVSAYIDFFRIIKKLAGKKEAEKISKRLPVLFMTGEDDAIGEFSKGVKRVYKKYKNAGIRDVSIKIYPQMRHELLHEKDKEQIHEDILTWILQHVHML